MATTYTLSESQLNAVCNGNAECEKIKDAHFANQQRLVKVNSYYGKKYSAQTKILKTIYIMVICVIAIYAIRVYTDFIPDWILTMAMSLVIGIFIINILFQSVDITNRNNMDYDLYDTNLSNLPKLAAEPGTSATGAGAGGTMPTNTSSQMSYGGGRGHCSDQQCCPTFYTFNTTLGYCSLNPFT